MAKQKEYPIRFTPRGLSDAWDSTDTFPGACLSLQNLIFDQSNPELVVSRPGVGNPLVNLAGPIAGATFISVYVAIGDVIYGLVNSNLTPGYDQPFAYNITTGLLLTIANIKATNVPATQPTTGDWTPPTISMIGDTLVFTSPGFSGGATTGSFTGAITGSLLTVTAPTGVISLGSNIAGASVATGTSITGFVSGTYGGAGVYTLSTTAGSPISSEAMTSASGAFFGVLNVAGMFWDATNTGVFPLPSVPLAVTNFNNRAYFACGNVSYFSDVLIPTNMQLAGQALTHGDTTPITGYGGLPVQTTSAGVIGALIVFKEFQIWQVTGDEAVTGSLAQNYLALNVGCVAPRSIVQTPVGILFAGIDGPYTILALGQVMSLTNNERRLVPDIQHPFQNIQHPSRAAASFTGPIYRICMQTVIDGVPATNDYWFDVTNRRWNGPHSFPYDVIDQAGNYFVIASSTLGAQIFASQYLPELNSVYVDNGSNIPFFLQTSLLPKTPNINMKQVVESTIELGNFGSTQLYQLTAEDETFNSIATATIQNQVADRPVTFGVPWNTPLVFKKLSISVSGNAGYDIQIGTIFSNYRDCGYTVNYLDLYLTTAPATPAGLTVVPGYGENTISWVPSFGADSYNIYWSLTPGAGTSGTEIIGATIPYVQDGLANGVPVYYVVTAVNVYGESLPSPQVSSIPSGVQFQNNSLQDVNFTNNSSQPVNWTT